jgi:hypothetical protein
MRAVILMLCVAAGVALADDAAGTSNAAGESASATADREIDHLLATVAQSDCVFVRNGREHDAAAASDHLALKRRRGKRYYSTADEFVDRLASKSSWSGKPYIISCDGEEQTANEWFSAALERYREAR